MSSPLYRIYWKLKKLPAMGPREVFFRIGRELAKCGERLAYRAGRFEWPQTTWQQRTCGGVDQRPTMDDLPTWWLQHMRARHEPPFLLNSDLLRDAATIYHREYGDRLQPLIARAERVCAGEFSFLGIDFQVQDPIPWQRDPLTGRDWPARFYADIYIPFCDGHDSRETAGDAKHVWELNRHEFLIDCAKAYYLTGESRYAQRVFKIIQSWIRANPYLQGVNWAGPLEVAVRALSWLWSYQFLRAWDGIPADAHWDLIRSFYQHGAYLYRHLEFYTSSNNHLVGEATALYLLGSFFPEFDESPRWRHRGWKVLRAEPERQFYEDGGSTEQSTSYHHYCLGFFLLAVLTRLRQNQPVPEGMLRRLEAAFAFSLWMTQPDGEMPRIGDADDSRSIRLGVVPTWDFRNLLSLGATVFQRSDMKAIAGSFAEDALWLLGASGHRVYQDLLAQTPQDTSRVFPHSGYAVLRSGWGPEDHHLCFDCGPIGKDMHASDIPQFTHGHADMLSLTVSAFGQPLLVDSGFYTFSGSPQWHRYCRDVEGHNTLRVDGASQAKYNVANAWSCAAQPGPILRQSKGLLEGLEGSHTGFHGLTSRVVHRRAVFWKRGAYWIILDRLEGEGYHEVESFFHFASGSVASLAGLTGVCATGHTGVNAVLQLAETNGLEVKVRTRQREPDGGWIATSYGRCEPAPLVRFYGRVKLPCSYSFVLIPFCGILAPTSIEPGRVVGHNGKPIDDTVSLRIRVEGEDDRFAFRWSERGVTRLDPYEFGTRFFFACQGDGGSREGVMPGADVFPASQTHSPERTIFL